MANIFKAKSLISRTGVFSNEVIAPNLVYNTGNQNVSGIKSFYSRPTVNGTGVLLSGEAASLPTTIVYTTGDQTISGVKVFQSTIVAKNISGGGGNLYIQGSSGADPSDTSVYIIGGYGSSYNAGEVVLQGGSGLYGGGAVSIYGGGDSSTRYYGSINVIGSSININNDNTAARSIAIYKTGVGGITNNVVINQGSVNVENTFTISGVQVTPLSYVTTGQTGVFYPRNNPSGFITGVNLTPYALANQVVYITGNQTISGTKTFANNLEVQGTGIFNALDLSNISEFNFSGTNINLISGNVNVSGQIYISGNPVLTGVDLSSYATTTNLASTGSTLTNNVTALSGLFTGFTGNLDTTFASDIQLANTGSTLVNSISSLSGTLTSNYATIANLASTGSTLNSNINSLSGLFTGYTGALDATFASDIQLANTGSNLDTKINNLSGVTVLTYGNQNITGNKTFINDINVSGSGIFNALDLNNIDVLSLSGVDISITSGNIALTNRPTVNGTGVVLSGELNSTGILLSNRINSLSGSLNSSGSNLNNSIISLSGLFTGFTGSLDASFASDIQLASTGSTLQTNINNLSNTYATITNVALTGSTLATNIASTGSTLVGSITSLSGLFTGFTGNLDATFATDTQVANTGTTLVNTINSLSGTLTSSYATISNLALTGSTLVSSINSLSGTLTSDYATISNLASTGSTLATNLASTGATLQTNINNLSNTYATITNLASTGVTLNTSINNLSGVSVLTFGNQTINGLKTFTSGIDIYSGASPQSLRIFNSTGTNSGEFALIGWGSNLGIVSTGTNALVIGTQSSNSGILRDVIITGNNIALYPNSGGRLYINGTSSLNDNLLQTSQCSGNITGFITGFGFTGNYTGNYEGGYFLGRTKLTQNTVQLVDSSFGSNYITKNTNAPSQNFRSVAVSSDGRYQITAVGNYSSALGYVYVSNDYGNTWTPRITDATRDWRQVAISADGKYQVACHNGGYIYVSNDYGNTWNAKDSVRNWLSIAISSDGKYQSAVSTAGVYISNNYGNTWTVTINNISYIFIAMSSDGKYQYLILDAGFGGSIFRSSDYGNTWVIIQSGSATSYGSIATSADGKYVIHNRTSSNNLYISNDYGNTFVAKSTTAIYFSVAISDNGKYMVAGLGKYFASTGGIYFSTDYGNTWKLITPSSQVWAVAMSSNAKYVIAASSSSSTPIHIFKTDELIDGNLTINNNLTLPSGDFYSYNATGVNSGEFGLIGWRNNQFVIGSQNTTSGILRDVLITGNNININGSGVLNIFDNTNIVGNLIVSGNVQISGGLFVSGNSVLTGVDLSSYAITTNLASTGSTLATSINSLSGLFTGFTGNLDATFASDDQLANTGSTLVNSISSLSGTLTSTYATISNLASTGSTLQSNINTLTNNLSSTGSSLDNKIGSLSGTLTSTYATISNLASTGSTLATNLASTGLNLDTKINTLSGSSVLLYGDQSIGGVKTFRDNVYINNLFVTGTETIVSTNNFNVQSPYLILNLTGGAVDGGIFFVTGAGLTGINDSGPIIGFDHSNKFKFGVSTRNSDLSTLPDIASVQDITAYSGFVDGKYSTIINLASTGSTLSTNLASTGSTLQTNINNLSNTYATITNLASTGSTLATNIASTGSTLQTNINNLSNTYATISNVALTGSTLVTNLASTGSTLVGSITSLSGLFTGFTGNLDTTFASDIQLANTGSTLVGSINSLSGTLTSNYATITNLASTGSTLNSNINSLSGTLTGNYLTTSSASSTYATITNLASTGSTLNTRINNLSGYINSTSSNIVFTTGNQTISGVKTFAENTTFGDTGQGDFLVISGNNFTVYGSGNFTSGLFVNGNAVLTGINLSSYATVTNLASTGSILTNNIVSLSGLFTGFTGNLDTTFASDIQLANTGSTLVNSISSLSGTLTSTYATILNLASTGSTLATNLANTGSTLQTNINNLSNTYATITNVGLTGSTIVNNITSLSGLFTGYTGSLDNTYATDLQVLNTGITLNTIINNLSGYINSSSSNIVFTTGNQTISGIKTFTHGVLNISIKPQNSGLEINNGPLILRSAAGTYGAARVEILNENGANGFTVVNEGLDLVDFGLQSSTNKKINFRMEGREEYSNGNNQEFQIIDVSDGAVYYARFGNNNIVIGENTEKIGVGTLTPTEKLEVVGNLKLSATNSKIIIYDSANGSDNKITWQDNELLFGNDFDNSNKQVGFLFGSGPLYENVLYSYMGGSQNTNLNIPSGRNGYIAINEDLVATGSNLNTQIENAKKLAIAYAIAL